jgi:hypothetical protein
MKNQQPAASTKLYSPRATLCAIGIKLRSLKLFDIIADYVKIKQKTIKHTSIEKLTDVFIAILAGARTTSRRPTRASARMPRCSGSSAARLAPSSRSSRRRSTPATWRTSAR